MASPRIHVIHENAVWSAPLFEELDALGLPFEDWNLIEGTVPIDREPPEGVFYNRMSASSHTRGHRFSPEYAAAVLAWLEGWSRPVVNDSRALRLELSKVAQYASLRAFGIPTPRTVAAVGREALIEAARSFEGPFITKHNRAGKGLGVHLFRGIEALEAYVDGPELESEPPIDGITLIQQYIEAPEPFIVRCEFVGGELLYAVRVDTSDGFQLCPADSCDSDGSLCPVSESDGTAGPRSEHPRPRFELIPDFRHPLVERLLPFLAANGIGIAGVELIMDRSGRPYVYDVNTNTNYNEEAERRAGLPRLGMSTIAAYLGGKLNARPIAQAAAETSPEVFEVSSPA